MRRVTASGLRGVGLAGLPEVVNEWRRLGRAFDGVVYFVYDLRTELGSMLGAHIHGRRRGIPFDTALAEVREQVAAVRQGDEVPAGAQVCEPETVLNLIRHIDGEACERMRREFRTPPPTGHVRMVLLKPNQIELEIVPIPMSLPN